LALKQALEAALKPDSDKAQKIVECVAAIRPVVRGKFPAQQALDELVGYTAPPAQTPPRLTDEQIDTIESAALVTGGDYTDAFRAIESAVRKQWAEHFGVQE
jgi:hypothetical protein